MRPVTTSRLRSARLRSESGSALIAIVMLIMVLSALGIGVIQVAQHSNDVTSVDRERLQTIEAAEAGINDAIRRIEAGAGCDTVAGAYNSLMDKTSLVGRFRTRIDPESGTLCNDTPRRVIHSWGYAATGKSSDGTAGARALRHLEVTVELVPIEGFPFTLFAEGNQGTIYIKNNGIVEGDVYAESVDQTKNNLTAQNVISPGSITTQNNVSYSGTLWAGGNVVIGEDGNIGGSILASGTAPSTAGNVVLDNGVVVGGDVTAKGSVTPSTAVVNGSITANDPNVPAPPALTKPAFVWNAANYSPAPTEGSAAAITTALSSAKNNLQGTYHSTDGGTVTVPSGATVTGPLAIVSTGKIVISGNMHASGGPWQVAMVALSNAQDAFSTGSTFTAASGLDVLMYSNGGFDMKNNVSFRGAIYADTIDAKNTFTIIRSTALMSDPPAGFTFVLSSSKTYSVVPTLWREVVPGLPPA
jgi:hypothetical protein